MYREPCSRDIRGELRPANGRPVARAFTRYAVSAFFGAAGIAHFTHTDTFERIMPSYIPFHRELVLASGVAEITGALAFAFGRGEVRRWSGLWLIATLLAVFPANVHMALHPDQYPEIWGGQTTLFIRLPLQFLLIAMIAYAMKPDDGPKEFAPELQS